MKLRVDLENRYLSMDICHEPMATTRDIADAMFLSEDFLQNITDVVGGFQRAVLLCLESAERMRNLANTSTSGDPDGIAKLRKLRDSQLKRMHHLQRRWKVLLQMARDFDESVTFRRLSDIIESTEDTVDGAWLHAKELMDPCMGPRTYKMPQPFCSRRQRLCNRSTIQPKS